MPTEELFGAYNFLLENHDGKSADGFDFKAEGGETEVAMLLPAVQAAREAARRTDVEEQMDDFQIADAPPEPVIIGLLLPAVQKSTIDPSETLQYGGWAEDHAAGGDHKEWIDILSLDQGINRSNGGDDFVL